MNFVSKPCPCQYCSLRPPPQEIASKLSSVELKESDKDQGEENANHGIGVMHNPLRFLLRKQFCLHALPHLLLTSISYVSKREFLTFYRPNSFHYARRVWPWFNISQLAKAPCSLWPKCATTCKLSPGGEEKVEKEEKQTKWIKKK